MKKYILSLLLVLPVFVFAQNSPADIPPPPVYVAPQQINAADLVNKDTEDVKIASLAIVYEPKFVDKVYNAGDIVNVSFTMENNDNVDYADISVGAFISIFSDSTKTVKEYGYQNDLVKFFIPKKSSKTVSFDYKLPEAISFKKDDITRIEMNIMTNSGQPIGYSGSFIKLGNFTESINVNDAYLEVNGNTYAVQEGPTIEKNQAFKFVTKLSNPNQTEISLTPVLSIHELQLTGPEILNKKFDAISLKPGEEKILKLDFPTFDKSGVYVSELNFVDQNNIPRSMMVVGRWIVGGDIVTIPSVSINKTDFVKGENALLEVTYTGGPINIDTGLKSEIGDGIIKASLYDLQNNLIATLEKQVSFNTSRETVTFEFPFDKNIVVASTSVVAVKDGVEIASYNAQLKDGLNNLETKNNSIYEIILLILLVVLVLGVIVFLSIKLKKTVITSVFIIAFSVFGIYSQVNAEAAWYVDSDGQWRNDNQFLSEGYLNLRNFTPGQEMSWYMGARASAQVCSNGGGLTDVTYHIYKYEPSNNTYNLVAAHNFKNWDGGITDSQHAINYFRNFTYFNPRTANQGGGGVYAPSQPGSYYMVQTMYLNANYRQAGRQAGDERFGGVGWRGPVQLGFWFSVGCAAGQQNVNGQCVSDQCTNIADFQSSVPAGTTRQGGACNCNNGTVNPPTCTICANGQSIQNGVCATDPNTPTTTPDTGGEDEGGNEGGNIINSGFNSGLGSIDTFRAAPPLINKGGKCVIEYSISPNGATLPDLTCTINSTPVQASTTIQKKEYTNVQNTTTYTLSCSSASTGYTESKTATCNVVPGVNEI